METDEAAASTLQALRSALDAAHQERQTLAERLATVDSLIADLTQAVSTVGATATSRQSSAKRTGKKTTNQRTGRKTAAKRSRKRSTRKGATRKRAGRSRQSQGPGRTDRVVDIISRASQPLTTGEVRSRVAEQEPDVSSKLVSAALSYAQQKERITRVADGRWTAA